MNRLHVVRLAIGEGRAASICQPDWARVAFLAPPATHEPIFVPGYPPFDVHARQQSIDPKIGRQRLGGIVAAAFVPDAEPERFTRSDALHEAPLSLARPPRLPTVLSRHKPARLYFAHHLLRAHAAPSANRMWVSGIAPPPSSIPPSQAAFFAASRSG